MNRRIWLSCEMGALYGGLPLAAYFVAIRTAVPLVPVILLTLLLFVAVLSLTRGFSWRSLLGAGVAGHELRSIAALFVPLGGLIAVGAYWFVPQQFLALPVQNTRLWMLILFVYPLISVQGQEIMYRVFFFRRYREVFGPRVWLSIVVNSGLFAFAHIIFGNWLAIAMTFAGSLLFGWRYHRSRSYWAVVLEHSLYGDLIFTVGLGRYFYLIVSRAAGAM